MRKNLALTGYSSSSILFLSHPKLAINQRNENTLTKKRRGEAKDHY